MAEVKSFPKVDDRVDPEKLGAASRPTWSPIIYLLREEIGRLERGSRPLGVRHRNADNSAEYGDDADALDPGRAARVERSGSSSR